MRGNIITLLCMFLAMANIVGQKGHELGGWVGGSIYYGDLNPSVNLQSPGPALGIIYKKNYNSRLSLRGGLSYANISGDDARSSNNFQRNRNLSFTSSIWDLSGAVEFNFFELIHAEIEHHFTPFVMLGASVFRYNPKAELDGVTYSLSQQGTEGQDIGGEYFLISGGFVLGGGFKWAIGNDYYVAIEASTRLAFTDYLDDVSTVYPDLDRLAAVRGPEAVGLSNRALLDGIGEEGRQRGNSKDNDRFAFIGISLMKYFGRIDCPKISKNFGDL